MVANMSTEERTEIAVKIVNLLSEKKCTVKDAFEILDNAERVIKSTTTVQSFEWSADKSQTV